MHPHWNQPPRTQGARRRPKVFQAAQGGGMRGEELAFTRSSFTSRRLCTNPSILLLPPPPALPTLLQYYYTTIAQYATPPPTPPLYAIHNTILAVAISCKGQARTLRYIWMYRPSPRVPPPCECESCSRRWYERRGASDRFCICRPSRRINRRGFRDLEIVRNFCAGVCTDLG